jgi:exopolysaccharide production protein ExoQ
MSGLAPAFARAGELTWSVRAQANRWAPDNRHALTLGAMVWLLTVLMIVPDGFDYSSLVTEGAPSSGSAISRLAWLGLLGGGVLVVLWRAKLAWLLLSTVNPFLLMFSVLAVASVAWSIDPGVTIRRLIRVATILVDALAFALMSWHPQRFQNVMRPIITIMLAGSIIFGLVNPGLAIHQSTSYELVNAWRGLTNHKNSLGALSCIGVIMWAHAWFTKEVKMLPALIGTGIAAACLILSRSSTSLVTAVFTVMFLLLLMRAPPGLRRYMPYLVGMFALALLTWAIAILRLVPGMDVLLQPIVAITGKDMNFTGRAEIWAIVSEHIRLHPILGTGYGAYWIGPVPYSPSYEFVGRMHFYPGSAHNGYLEIVNDLGSVGLVCLIGYLVVHMRQALGLLKLSPGQGSLYLGLLLQQAITNLSESHWFSVLSVGFVITTLATAAMARMLLEQKLRFYFGEPDLFGSASLVVNPSSLVSVIPPDSAISREAHAVETRTAGSSGL